MRAIFERKEIVWGKIEPYPWWPGKIISMHIQCDEIIYKILFFADTTYAYLQQSQLQSYQQFDRNINTHFSKNSRLNKAIRMADQSYAKLKIPIDDDSEIVMHSKSKSTASTKNQSTCNVKQSDHIISSDVHEPKNQQCDEIEIEQDQNKENLDRIKSEETMIHLHSEKEMNGQAEIREIEEITTDNIIDILRNRMRDQQRFEYNYQSRKNRIKHKIQLKRKLLEKYNLFESFAAVESQVTDNKHHHSHAQLNIPKRKKLMKSKIHRKKHDNDTSQLKTKCIRKFYQMLRISSNSNVYNDRLKVIAVNSIKKMLELSEKNHSLFKTMYINIIKIIQRQRTCQSSSLEVMLAELNSYLDRLEGQKNEEEEGSKMTQVSVPY